jgi:hypothetical protein
MKRSDLASAIAAFIVLASATIAPARAAPPTVTPSPGYDARLQEQRAATVINQPVEPAPRPVHRHRAKRVPDGAH